MFIHMYINVYMYGSLCPFNPPWLYGMNDFQENNTKSMIFGLKIRTAVKLLQINSSSFPKNNCH